MQWNATNATALSKILKLMASGIVMDATQMSTMFAELHVVIKIVMLR